MTEPGELFRDELPEELMEQIEKRIREAGTAETVLEAAVLPVFDWALIANGSSWQEFKETGESLSAMSVAIPEHQWQQICQWLVQREDALPLDAVSLAMGWVNVGPSAY